MNSLFSKTLIFINNTKTKGALVSFLNQKKIDHIVFENINDYLLELESIKIKNEYALSIIEISNIIDIKNAKKLLQEYPDNNIVFLYNSSIIKQSDIYELLTNGAIDALNIETDLKLICMKIMAYSSRILKNNVNKVKEIKDNNGKLLINLNELCVYINGNTKYILTKKQISILSLLVMNENHAVSRHKIAMLIYSSKIDSATPQMIDKHIQLIRQKIPEIKDSIKTVYGVGYMYESLK